MSARARRRQTRGSVLGGTLLMGLGAWFLADNMGYALPGWDSIWPIFPTLGGLAFIVSFFSGRERDAGVLIPGVGGFLCGLFFFAFTAGPLHWSDMSDWWPIFPIIAGIAFFATWAATRPWDHSLLVPAGMGMVVGLCGLMITVAGLRLRFVWRLWPLGLIVMGLWMLLMGLGTGKARRAGDSDGG